MVRYLRAIIARSLNIIEDLSHARFTTQEKLGDLQRAFRGRNALGLTLNLVEIPLGCSRLGT